MSGSLIFITGSTGFIGSHVVRVAVEAGYRVRLSIRKPEQAQKVLSRYPEYQTKIETVLIPDLTRAESFKSALGNVDYVFHLATPMPGSGSDVRTDYVYPAVQSTEAILYAAADFPQIKKVVVVSSLLALAPVDALIAKNVVVKDNTGEIIPVDLDMAFPDGANGQALRYSVSKIKAHQATRDFLQQNKPHYTLITLHPTFVLGDSLVQETAKDIDGVNGWFWQSLFSEKPLISTCWVHVRDVADAHIKVLEFDVKSSKEFILAAPEFPWEDAISFIKTHYPNLGIKLEPPFDVKWKVDTSAAETILGLQWRSKEKTIQDVIDQQLSFKEGGA